MASVRRLRDASMNTTAHYELDEASLQRRLDAARNDFEYLAEAAGLPWVDKDAIRKQILVPAGLPQLPVVDRLNDLIRRQVQLAHHIRDVCDQRERLLLLLVRDACAFQETHLQECTTELHEWTAKQLRAIDDLSDTIIHLVQEWRKGFMSPLPFLYKKENYLLRMAKQCAVGNEISTASSHLRATSRHCSFFYASPYDPVAVQAMTLNRDEMVALDSEHQTQMKLCEQQMSLAMMGVYIPVLRFRTQPGRPINAQTIFIEKKAWKERLIRCYSTAIHMLKAIRHTTTSSSTTTMASQFAMISSHSLHIRYYRKWMDWMMRRRAINRGIQQLLVVNRTLFMAMRFTTWKRRWQKVTTMTRKQRQLTQQSTAIVLTSFIRKWFTQHSVWKLARSVRRAMYLKYFHAFHFLVLRKQLRQDTGGRDNKVLRNLYMVSLLRPLQCHALRHVRETVTVHRPWLMLINKEEEERHELRRAVLEDIAGEAAAFMVEYHRMVCEEIYEQYHAYFAGDYSTMVLHELVVEEKTVRQQWWDRNCFERSEMTIRLLLLHERDLEFLYARESIRQMRDYLQFVNDNIELQNLSFVMAKREQLLRRESRSRKAVVKRRKKEAPK